MSLKACLLVFSLCLLMCVMVGLASHPVQAQKAGGMEDLSTKKGFEVLGGSKKKDDKNSPTQTQMMIGVGSIFVMIAVVKWL